MGSIIQEIESTVDAKRLWKVFRDEGSIILMKRAADIFKSITSLKGEGGVGSIKQINFTPEIEDSSWLKLKLEEVDEENFGHRYSHVEGGLLGLKVSPATYEFKFTPKAEGGCVFSYVAHFDSLPGDPEDEEKVKEIKEMIIILFKKIEAYLIDNPDLYC
ncbi:hypothetical protein SUGI_0130910 [Cryptomeria japonica]|uniref:major pollen allergen Bet v 1-D/H-like n=1 Tax=Cryptomeria japonica TaxID=3369 RepID=UPI002408B994|nr:major pollen allergen Bet v 1-D/H-like [Cryptomeria japonica]GLJ10570.1 hypothetical protein SUGI_0130910 [Cryptomeria japonica]